MNIKIIFYGLNILLTMIKPVSNWVPDPQKQLTDVYTVKWK